MKLCVEKVAAVVAAVAATASITQSNYNEIICA